MRAHAGKPPLICAVREGLSTGRDILAETTRLSGNLLAEPGEKELFRESDRLYWL